MTATPHSAECKAPQAQVSSHKSSMLPQDALMSVVLLVVLAYCWGLGDGKAFSRSVNEVVHVAFWFLPRNLAVGIHWVFSFVAALGAICIAVSPVPSLGNKKVVKFAAVATTIAAVYQLLVRTLALGPWCLRTAMCGALPILMRMYSPQTKLDEDQSLFSAWVVSLRIPPFAALIAPVTISLITMECLGAPVISAERATAAVLALCLLQASANQINSVADFLNGIDDIHTASDRSLVDGILTPKTMVWSAVSLTGLSAVFLLLTLPGVDLAYWSYAILSWITQASFAVSVVATSSRLARTVVDLESSIQPSTVDRQGSAFSCQVLYTSGPFPLKYYAMGDLVMYVRGSLPCFAPACGFAAGPLHQIHRFWSFRERSLGPVGDRACAITLRAL
ncbi:UbiA prenyltransferase domain-containing protein 1 [Perkinsus olseni]|uniref:UbiA prenyltransferase domain-containing protein 1 n=1 Tax=Perkinsus olseni TaxID=32597 RepID=A0A7J6SK74_PEROL|nr:UbiA prenyltransferase domain-containing protein 1 [Perkinsus olseni]